jgi:hypothetical protein
MLAANRQRARRYTRVVDIEVSFQRSGFGDLIYDREDIGKDRDVRTDLRSCLESQPSLENLDSQLLIQNRESAATETHSVLEVG